VNRRRAPVTHARSGPALQFAMAVLLSGSTLRPASFHAPAGPGDGPAADAVSGWVVDANDWLDQGSLEPSARQPARTSADLGSPLVILADDGSLVYPLALTATDGFMRDTVRLKPFAGQRVRATGRIVTRSLERGILIDRVTRAPGSEGTKPQAARQAASASVTGRVAALSCWLGSGESGAAHVGCARAHAWACDPLVLVDDSGRIYYPLVRDKTRDRPGFISLIKYCEQTVAATGTVITRGSARAIVIDRVEPFATGEASMTSQTGALR
jgi:hypothetical protein